MNLNPSVLNAALRHVYTAVAAVTGTLVVVGMSQGDATTIGTAIHQIGDGIASIVAGVTALVPIVTAGFAAWTAMRKPQIAAVAAMPGTKVSPDGKTITIVEPELAKAAKEAATPPSGKP